MRTKKGIVTSAKMQNTVTVMVTRLVMHEKYRKRYPMSKKFLADTGGKAVKEGDTVLISETRPMSRRKRFAVVEVLSSGVLSGSSLDQELGELFIKKKKSTSSEDVPDRQEPGADKTISASRKHAS